MNVFDPPKQLPQRFVITAVYESNAQSPRDEGCLRHKTFVFEPNTSIAEIYARVFDLNDPVKSVFGTKPIRIEISADENSLAKAL